MPASSEPQDAQRPVGSIILPTYNRARFLPEAIQSIRDQQWTDWELIVVDDGSTDETPELLPQLTADIGQPVRFIRQENQGAYAARNTGLDHGWGKYIAFFDSDDLWLPHHLHKCVEALEANPDVDWAYGACRLVDYASGETLAGNSFYVDGTSRPFMSLPRRCAGDVHVIEASANSAAICQILHGFYCGLQNSLLRRTLFADYRFETASRNEAEDQMIVIDLLLRGGRLAYIDRVHVDYRMHADNSSAAGASGGWEKKVRVLNGVVEGFEKLLRRPGLSRTVRRAIRQRLGTEYFWLIGYAMYWMKGDKPRALHFLSLGLRRWPWAWRRWITFVGCVLRRPGARERRSANLELST